MPRLHPLATETPSLMKPPPLQMGSSVSPQASKISTSAPPAMPQLHKMPSMGPAPSATPHKGVASHAPPLKPSPTLIRAQSDTSKSTSKK